MNEYRCVRMNLYPETLPRSAMQGHYILAETKEEAKRKMEELFGSFEEYHIEVWHKNVRQT